MLVNDESPLTNGSVKAVEIELNKGPKGFGFNIVGGCDSEHIPGDSGIFVSKVSKDGVAYSDGRLSEGDRILSVNGINLGYVTHKQAVAVFASVKGLATLLVEPDAERTLVNKPTTFAGITDSESNSSPVGGRTLRINPTPPSSENSPGSRENSSESMVEVSTRNTQSERYSSQIYARTAPRGPIAASYASSTDVSAHEKDILSDETILPTIELENGVRTKAQTISSVDDDRLLTLGMNPIIDDVPRTPKKPTSILDPSNPSIFTEILFVSVGLAALGVGIYVGIRIFRGRRS
ncbi:hypothetical protein AB6A40_003501 [Gnathostoma spinigerum]|uniref:PDZ domain-containing protein n=1 Tax=Gnathostoma spinigerum TaxID=75299 RepID=A0ABD6EJQ4_9BILA